jgi:hypothetical protein
MNYSLKKMAIDVTKVKNQSVPQAAKKALQLKM